MKQVLPLSCWWKCSSILLPNVNSTEVRDFPHWVQREPVHVILDGEFYLWSKCLVWGKAESDNINGFWSGPESLLKAFGMMSAS